MKCKVIISLVLSLALAGCLSNKVVKKEAFSQYSTLIIKKPSLNNIIVSNMDEDEQKSFDINKHKYASLFQEKAYKKILKKKVFKNVSKDTTNEAEYLLLDCEFIEFDAGNRALRHYVGFGLGKTKVEVQCKL